MNYSFFAVNRLNIASLVFAVCAVSIGGCSSTSTGTSPLSVHQVTKRTTSSYNVTVVEDPSGTNTTQVWGIDDSKDIVGTYQDAASGNTNSFTSQGPGYSSFSNADYPDAPNGSIMDAIAVCQVCPGLTVASPTIEAGYAWDPGGGSGDLHGYWATVDAGGLWTIIQLKRSKSQNKFSSPCRDNRLLGINAQGIGVGYWAEAPTASVTANQCENVPDEVPTGGATQSIQLPPSWNFSSAEATGIDNSNPHPDFVGIFTVISTGGTKSSLTSGWYELNSSSGAPTQLSYKSGSTTYNTYLSGINNSHEMVGWWVGSGGKSHGFTYTKAGGFQLPDLYGNYEFTGINDYGDLCGWYQDSSGNQHGFVATPVSGTVRKSHR